MKDDNFYKEIGKKGGLVRRKNKIDEYNKNPNYCKECGAKIEIKDGEKPSITRQRFYCSKECKSKGHSKAMRGNKNREVNNIVLHCLNCGEELINTQTKYCSVNCQNEYIYNEYIKNWKLGLENVLRGKNQISTHIIKYIKDKYKHKCCKCGWDKVNPITGKSPLEIHHKDGDYSNNDEDNLELLCPNCHSLTENYKALNKNGRKNRY